MAKNPRKSWLSIFSSSKSKKVTAVQVKFRDLHAPVPEADGREYTYSWPLPQTPQIGDRVIVPGADGPAPAVIVALGVGPSAVGTRLEPVRRMVTTEEVAAAHQRHADAQERWFNIARRAAGLPTKSRARKIPDGFPDIPPVDGTADRNNADRFGRGWWRIYKQAEESQRDAEELKRFKSIAYRWFAIRDKQS